MSGLTRAAAFDPSFDFRRRLYARRRIAVRPIVYPRLAVSHHVLITVSF